MLERLHYHVNFMELSFLLLICNEIHRRLDYIMDRLGVSRLVTFIHAWAHACVHMSTCMCIHEHMHVPSSTTSLLTHDWAAGFPFCSQSVAGHLEVSRC